MLVRIRGDVPLPDDSKLGEEFLLRVRLVEIREETIEVTSFGASEPEVLSGTKTGDLIFLAARYG